MILSTNNPDNRQIYITLLPHYKTANPLITFPNPHLQMSDRILTPDNPSTKIRISVDLVAAARRHLTFLRSLPYPLLLPHRSIRRYEELWMPMIAGLMDSSAVILPPADVRWIWHCHCVDDPVVYWKYCESRFGTVIQGPTIFDEENEDYATIYGQKIWEERYPSEPFDLEMESGDEFEECGGEISEAMARHQNLVAYFSDTFVSETVYLVSAKQRYMDLLYLARKYGGDDRGLRMVPASDVLLMWLTHKSYPVIYGKDLNEFGGIDKIIVRFGDQASEDQLDETRRIWEDAFDEPYERPGALVNPLSSQSRVYFNWEASDVDVNRVYKGLHPRHLMEVCIFFKGNCEGKGINGLSKTFLRLRTARCHRELKLNKSFSNLNSATWKKTWHLYCEFGTKGIFIEVREQGGSWFRNSKLLNSAVFAWNDLLRSTSLTLSHEVEKQLRVLAAITPPVQAPYFLKCVPDRVTDNSGAMISEVILRMNRYRPQEGRWLTRTVLDHNGKECFVIRIRVGRGIWRRGAENPAAVKWEDRIIEVREGPWSYVASSVGSAPEKVVGTAYPKRDDSQEKKAIWCMSNGDRLMIQWDSGLDFLIENEDNTDQVRLLRGRKLQYQIKNEGSSNKTTEEEDEHYITLARYSPKNPEGKATALLNWKRLAVEFLPEEDAVRVLLLCTAVSLTISEVAREDVSGWLIRRRLREVKAGLRDWGSVLLPSSSSLCSVSPFLQPWYWNAREVLKPDETNEGIRKYSPADGRDALYRQSIVP